MTSYKDRSARCCNFQLPRNSSIRKINPSMSSNLEGQPAKAALLRAFQKLKQHGHPVTMDAVKEFVAEGRQELNKRALEEERDSCEKDLGVFLKHAWASIDSAHYQESWAVDALCEHLQAVKNGEIRHLLINYPPRCTKTTVTSICYPAWMWAQQKVEFLSTPEELKVGPQLKFLCGSYSDQLSLQNSNLTRRLILSPWYQKLWGNRFTFMEDQNTKTQYDTSLGGS